jgi:hypothetical protein
MKIAHIPFVNIVYPPECTGNVMGDYNENMHHVAEIKYLIH